MSFVRSQGVDIYYERHGKGPAVVFCHGAGSNAATWWQQVPTFAKKFSCITFDQRCFGRSVAPLKTLTWDQMVADLLAILDKERISKAALVCQSLGGGAGLRLTMRHPDRVWAFVPCDSPLGVADIEVQKRVDAFLANVDGKKVEQRALARAFQFREADLAFLYQQINSFNPSVYSALGANVKVPLMALSDQRNLVPIEDLVQVSCPTLFVVGAEDPLVTPDLARHITKFFLRGRLEVIVGAGHSPYFERPQAFNGRVLQFLESF